MTTWTRRSTIAVLGLFGCAAPTDDRDDDVVDRIDLAAPLVLELAPGAQLVIADANVVGIGSGTVVIDALAIDADAGAVLDLAVSEGATAMRVAGPDGSRRLAAAPASELGDDAHAVEAELVGLELAGFEAAWLEGPDGRVALAEPIVLDASALAWTTGELVVIELRDEASTASTTASARATVTTRRPAGPVVVGELGHTLAGDSADPFLDDLRADDEPLALEPGDSCSATSQCPTDTRCVADPMMSDGQFRCLALCVAPELQGGPALPAPSDSAVCVDDGSCCDPALACSNGQCVGPEPDDDGGSMGSGCDRDGDKWINACDARPDESCTADQDGDGCKDSFDDDDSDSCNCTTPVRIPRPNATAFAMLALVWLRGRNRR